jgi:hypothetical protein
MSPRTLALLSTVITLAWSGAATASGTWQTTLEGLDLDPARPGYEAYYDKTLNITWLTDLGAVQASPYAYMDAAGATPRAFFDKAKLWLDTFTVGGVSGWRLPSPDEFQSMFFTTLGHTTALLSETGPFVNFAPYTSVDGWVSSYVWTSNILGHMPDGTPVIQTFGFDGFGWNSAYPGNPMVAWAVHNGRAKPAALLGGSADWALQPYAVVCKNNRTGQVVNAPKWKRKTFDCAAQGLASNPGDSISITVTGTRR